MQLSSIGFDQRRLFECGVIVEVPHTDEVVQPYGGEDEYRNEVVEVELNKAVVNVRVKDIGDSSYRKRQGIR